MRLPWSKQSRKAETVASSEVISDTYSSPVSSNGGYSTTGFIYPQPSFATRYDAYDTIGRIFTAVESVVKAVSKRDFYFANADEKDKNDFKVNLMETWEKQYNGSKFVEDLTRTWLMAGTAIFGPDYTFVPMQSVKYMQRDIHGNIKKIVLNVNGREWPLGYVEQNGSLIQKFKPEDYTVTHYIQNSRDAWGKNLYYALCTTFTDLDGKQSTPLYQGFRQIEQDGIRMHHRIASPRTIWSFPKLKNPKDLDIKNPKSLAYRINKMLPGDRIVGGQEFEGAEIKGEPIEGRTRFTEVTDLVKGEVEVAAQSSAARLIEDPSAMADAREANVKDSDTTLYVCELVRRLFDYVIIPKVIGDQSVVFHWGSADNFQFNFEQTLAAVQTGIISIEEARDQWKAAGAKLDDIKFQNSLKAKQQIQQLNPPASSFFPSGGMKH